MKKVLCVLLSLTLLVGLSGIVTTANTPNVSGWYVFPEIGGRYLEILSENEPIAWRLVRGTSHWGDNHLILDISLPNAMDGIAVRVLRNLADDVVLQLGQGSPEFGDWTPINVTGERGWGHVDAGGSIVFYPGFGQAPRTPNPVPLRFGTVGGHIEQAFIQTFSSPEAFPIRDGVVIASGSRDELDRPIAPGAWTIPHVGWGFVQVTTPREPQVWRVGSTWNIRPGDGSTSPVTVHAEVARPETGGSPFSIAITALPPVGWSVRIAEYRPNYGETRQVVWGDNGTWAVPVREFTGQSPRSVAIGETFTIYSDNFRISVTETDAPFGEQPRHFVTNFNVLHGTVFPLLNGYVLASWDGTAGFIGDTSLLPERVPPFSHGAWTVPARPQPELPPVTNIPSDAWIIPDIGWGVVQLSLDAPPLAWTMTGGGGYRIDRTVNLYVDREISAWAELIGDLPAEERFNFGLLRCPQNSPFDASFTPTADRPRTEWGTQTNVARLMRTLWQTPGATGAGLIHHIDGIQINIHRVDLGATLPENSLPLDTTPPHDGINVRLDGRYLTFDVPPQIIDNRTMVPLRAIFEALGATVAWNEDTRTVTAVRGDTVVVMQVGNYVITVNGNEITLDVPPLIVDNRTLVPARAVAESFGANVDWNAETQTVIIESSRVAYFERRIFELTNIERVSRGLSPLIWDDRLATAARGHSEDLSVNRLTGHIGSDGSDVGERLRRAGITSVTWTENVVTNVIPPVFDGTPDFFVRGWMNSPGHRANILDPNLTHLGVGLYSDDSRDGRLAATQKFARF